MDPVIHIINRSNQRGGRMLSVIDLLEAGTLDRTQASWLIRRIEQGASFLIGANPGGGGKTTIQGALLAMLPAGETVRLARPGTGWEQSRPGDCIVAYEIGRGHYEAYIWGGELVRMTALGQQGCRIVTNLHADTLDEARQQIVVQSGAGEAALAAFETFVPIRTGGGAGRMTRMVEQIDYWARGAWRVFDAADHAPTPREEAIAAFLDACAEADRRTVEAVREAWLDWRAAHPA